VKDFAREEFVRKGFAVDVAIHAPDRDSDDRNHHAHLLITMRTVGEEGFSKIKESNEQREARRAEGLTREERLDLLREKWAHLANRHLERHGHEARIDHRSLKAQGIDDREATVHVGYAANEMAHRGAQSDRIDALLDVLARNQIRIDIRGIDLQLAESPESDAQWSAALGREWEPDKRVGGYAARADRSARNPLFEFSLPSKTAAAQHEPLKVLDGATGVVAKLADFQFEQMSGPEPAHADPARTESAHAKSAAPDEARAARAAMALLNIHESLEKGEPLSAADLRDLSREHRAQIRANGDEAIRQILNDAGDDASRYRKEIDVDRGLEPD
jgi:hypothetical protein